MSNWKQGPCECCNDPGLCCFAFCCPCFAYKEMADNTGDSNGCLYCVATLCGCGCCVLTMQGDAIAQKRGIDEGIPLAALKACFDGFVCYSCTVLNETRVMKSEAAGGGVKGQEMQR
ncbi:expressed unknown protein [Seminavis robusta]|uniref:Uncharacterized protein n=1 Tax=Seminavis robusta TaxID=568900 RepID=A0A9N8E2V9_9STRA|nr:expressed unknown protein [Seminavis robusta]|eukprot:Sro595_g172600.1 n/a (117) ;mRNA; r:16908-17258